MTEQKIDGYWFAASDRLPHGDGRKIIIGKTHSKRGEIIICQRGFHASRDPFDALSYAPGHTLYRVQVWGNVQEQDDKLCGRHRTYLAVRDTEAMLRHYARRQALTCIDKWDAPQIVRDYLETGNDELRNAAESAAGSAAESAAWSPAWSAAWSAARNAARSAAWSAAWSAARSAAESAAWSAARSAAWSAAGSAAGSAAWSAAWSAAGSAAGSAAWSAARTMFNEMVVELFAEEPTTSARLV